MIIWVGAGQMPIIVTTTAMVQNLNVEMLEGHHSSDFAPVLHNHDADYVNITGDTMIGPLFLANNGLTVGTSPTQPQLAVRAGNVGIGTSNPLFKLQTQ